MSLKVLLPLSVTFLAEPVDFSFVSPVTFAPLTLTSPAAVTVASFLAVRDVLTVISPLPVRVTSLAATEASVRSPTASILISSVVELLTVTVVVPVPGLTLRSMLLSWLSVISFCAVMSALPILLSLPSVTSFALTIMRVSALTTVAPLCFTSLRPPLALAVRESTLSVLSVRSDAVNTVTSDALPPSVAITLSVDWTSTVPASFKVTLP